MSDRPQDPNDAAPVTFPKLPPAVPSYGAMIDGKIQPIPAGIGAALANSPEAAAALTYDDVARLADLPTGGESYTITGTLVPNDGQDPEARLARAAFAELLGRHPGTYRATVTFAIVDGEPSISLDFADDEPAPAPSDVIDNPAPRTRGGAEIPAWLVREMPSQRLAGPEALEDALVAAMDAYEWAQSEAIATADRFYRHSAACDDLALATYDRIRATASTDKAAKDATERDANLRTALGERSELGAEKNDAERWLSVARRRHQTVMAIVALRTGTSLATLTGAPS